MNGLFALVARYPRATLWCLSTGYLSAWAWVHQGCHTMPWWSL